MEGKEGPPAKVPRQLPGAEKARKQILLYGLSKELVCRNLDFSPEKLISDF